MKYISKKTKIILIVIAIVGIIAGGFLGFLSGINYAKFESSKPKNNTGKITTTSNEKISKSYQVTASNDQEFVNFIKNISTNFNDKKCSTYTVLYDKLKFEVTGKTAVDIQGYNILDLKVYYEDKLISKELLNASSELGYSNVLDVLSLTDEKTELFIVIMNVEKANIPVNYIIAFTKDGKVLLNDENVQKNYFISSTVADNIEIKEFGYNFKLYPELYLNDVDQTTCSNEFMDKIKDSKDDDIVFAKRTYDFVLGELKEKEVEKKTILEEKKTRNCQS